MELWLILRFILAILPNDSQYVNPSYTFCNNFNAFSPALQVSTSDFKPIGWHGVLQNRCHRGVQRSHSSSDLTSVTTLYTRPPLLGGPPSLPSDLTTLSITSLVGSLNLQPKGEQLWYPTLDTACFCLLHNNIEFRQNVSTGPQLNAGIAFPLRRH
jgi:hypothetical protein